MKVLHITDFDPKGSGYGSITIGLDTELSRRGHQVVVLGMDNGGQEHRHPFTVVPSDPRLVAPQARQCITEFGPEITIVSLDLTWHTKAIELQGPDRPLYVGIFAVEGGPMIAQSEWANTIRRMDLAYSISFFGMNQVRDANIACEFLPIGVDDFWRPLEAEQRQHIRQMLGLTDRFIVMTVADNQERKNLPAAFEAVARLNEKIGDNKVYYIIVTKQRPQFIGWNLWALARDFGIERNILILDQGVERDKLREFYGISDAFLLTSKAEGLCLPIIEAMGCGLPCVASDVCDLPRMLEGRGELIKSTFDFIDPFGNTRRSFVSPTDAAAKLFKLYSKPELRERYSAKSIDYARHLTWSNTADKLEEDIRVKQAQRQANAQNNQAQGPRPAGVDGLTLVPAGAGGPGPAQQ